MFRPGRMPSRAAGRRAPARPGASDSDETSCRPSAESSIRPAVLWFGKGRAPPGEELLLGVDVRGAQDPVVRDEVERRVDPLDRHPRPLRVRQPVQGQLQLLAVLVRGIPRRPAGLPVDDLEPVAVGVDGVDLADHDAAGERQLDLALDLDRLARRPRRALEDLLQLGQPLGIDRIAVRVELESGGIQLVGAGDAPVALLHPGVEQRAEPGRPVRLLRHRAPHRRGHGIRVAHEVLEPRRGHPHRQRRRAPSCASRRRRSSRSNSISRAHGPASSGDTARTRFAACSTARRRWPSGSCGQVTSSASAPSGFSVPGSRSGRRRDHARVGEFEQERAGRVAASPASTRTSRTAAGDRARASPRHRRGGAPPPGSGRRPRRGIARARP